MSTSQHNAARRQSLQPPLKPVMGFPVVVGSPSSGLVERIIWDIYTFMIGLYLEGENCPLARFRAVADWLSFFWGFRKEPWLSFW